MKNIFRLTAVALLAATLFSACTGAFEDMNTNPKGVSDEELKQDNNYIGMHFIPMMQSIYYNKSWKRLSFVIYFTYKYKRARHTRLC